MAISYAGAKLIPSPFLSLTKSYNTSADGTRVGSIFNIVIDGTILPTKGSPLSDGSFWMASGYPSDESVSADGMMSSLIRKQEGIRSLFSNEGQDFKVDGWDGFDYLKCNPRIKNIEFPKGGPISWNYKGEYRVTLEADVIYLYSGTNVTEDTGIVSGFKIESADESWNLENTDENVPLYRLSHQVNAKGKRFYDSTGALVQPAWQNARDYVISKLGIDYNQLLSGVALTLSGYSAFNYLRSQNTSVLGGTFGVTETWIAYKTVSGYKAHEDFDVNIRIDETDLTTVSVQGRIQGMQERDNANYNNIISSKWDNASGKYFLETQPAILNRAQTYAGITLNPNPVNQTIGLNQLQGTVNYNIEYNNRPTASISGARSESIALSWSYPRDIFAELAVLNRTAGPVLQSIQTTSATTQTLNIEAVMPAKTQSYTPAMPNTASIVASYVPSATWVFKSNDTESWDQNHGRYSRQVVWTYGS